MGNLLSEVHPELIEQWSERNLPLTPDKITYGSNKIVWWKGACGHEWQTSIKARSNGENCPICSGARVVEGINDLATLKPELMLVIASACKNMWVSLGIGVILVFTLSILPQDNIVLSLFPFASPYQMLSAAVENSRTALFLAVCGIETVVFGIAEVLYLQVRRCFE